MSNVYFSSDLHLGDDRVVKFRTQFSSFKDHDMYMLDLLSKLKTRDVCYLLGDILVSPFSLIYLETLKKMPATFKILPGNHCIPGLNVYEPPLIQYKHMLLSHVPIHIDTFRGAIINVHGHIHNHNIPLNDDRYFNVNIDVNNFQLVHLDTIKVKAKSY